MLHSCENPADFDDLLSTSASEPVFLLKHSTRCPISAGAHSRYTRFAEAHPDVPCRIVLVVEQRALSQQIAAATGVAHQSPQALLFVDGQCVWHISHGNITEHALADALAQHPRSA
jgi:bacillithiol system protein YtxJ